MAIVDPSEAAGIDLSRLPSLGPDVQIGVGPWKDPGPSWQMPTISDLRVNLRVEGNDDITFQILESDAAKLYSAGYDTPNRNMDVWFMRNNVGIQRFRINAVSHGVDADGIYTMKIQAEDYRSYLRNHRPLEVDLGATEYSVINKAQETIVSELMTYVNGQSGGASGITYSNPGNTTLRTVSYKLGTMVGSIFDTLGNMRGTSGSPLSGFDWYIGYNKALVLSRPYMGTDSSSVHSFLTFPGNLDSFQIDESSDDYANAGTQVGADNSIFNSVAVSDILTRYEGRWGKVWSESNAGTSALVVALSQKNLDKDSIDIPLYTIPMRRNTWGGTSDIGLGDYVGVFLNAGPINQELVIRVMEIALSYDDDGTETCTLTVAKPKATLRSIVRGINKRLNSAKYQY